jgi:glycosyltransferase involved in cell wall biosynthesis
MGGVTVSIKNLIVALASKGIRADLLGRKMRIIQYDVAHIHYSNLAKRLLGVLLAKLLARKVIFTVHGKFLDMDNRYNQLSVKLSDGVIVLNAKLLTQLNESNLEVNCTLLPSIFAEGFDGGVCKEDLIEKESGYTYLLLYAFDKNFKDGHEVYGVSFILENLHLLEQKYKFVLLDINGRYREDVVPHLDRVIYIDKVVNFVSLLNQVDVYVRPTFMDGASVAVQEALVMNVPVLASDVVDRPEGVVVYKYMNIKDFISKLEETNHSSAPFMELQSVDKYLDFCQKLN